MEKETQSLLIDISQHLSTLGLAAMGFVLTVMFTSVGKKPLLLVTVFKNSLHGSLIAFFLSVIASFLVQASVLSIALGYPQRSFLSKPVFLLVVSWMAFVFGVLELFVFARATAFGGVPLGF